MASTLIELEIFSDATNISSKQLKTLAMFFYYYLAQENNMPTILTLIKSSHESIAHQSDNQNSTEN